MSHIAAVGWIDSQRKRGANTVVGIPRNVVNLKLITTPWSSAYELYYRSQRKRGRPLSQPTSNHLDPEGSAELPHLDSPERLALERGAEEPALRFKRTFSRNVKVHFVGAWYVLSHYHNTRPRALILSLRTLGTRSPLLALCEMRTSR